MREKQMRGRGGKRDDKTERDRQTDREGERKRGGKREREGPISMIDTRFLLEIWRAWEGKLHNILA